MGVKTKPFEAAEFLESEEDMVSYLQAVMEERNLELFRLALSDIAKAKGMTELAETIGVNRQSLYRSLSKNGNPSFATI
nr:putative addiction module antidote protein [Alcaligenaceae bacterium]